MEKLTGIHFYINIVNFSQIILEEEAETKRVTHSIHALDTFFSSIESFGKKTYPETLVVEKVTGSKLHLYVLDAVQPAFDAVRTVSVFARRLAGLINRQIPKYRSLPDFRIQVGAACGVFCISEFRLSEEVSEITSIGYAANFAAKLLGLSGPSSIAVSEQIYHSLPAQESPSGALNQLPQEEIECLSQRSRYVADLVNKGIENCDNKISISCTVLTMSFGVFSFLSERLVNADSSSLQSHLWQFVMDWGFFFSMLAMGIAILLFCFALKPNLKSSGESSGKKYPVFFGDIASLTAEEYEEKLTRASDQDFIREMIRETQLNAEICLRKMKLYRLGIIASMVAIVLAIMTFVTRYLVYLMP